MKVAIFPIGIESSSGRQYSPVMDDGRFHYIPIPEFSLKKQADVKKLGNILYVHKRLINNKYDIRTYEHIEVEKWPEYPNLTTLGDFLENRIYLGAPIRSYIPHYDPEFITCTYGEGSNNKAKTLSELRKNDMLAFYMTLARPIQRKVLGKFLVGYFIIEEVFDYRFSGESLDYHAVPERILHNFHVIRTDLKPVIAAGSVSESRLFRKALQFTDNTNWEILPDILEQIEWPFDTTVLGRGTRILRGQAAEIFRAFLEAYDG
ncbi:MAG: hypothetical protein R6U96_10500 [Promethearchaeia archaeon]